MPRINVLAFVFGMLMSLLLMSVLMGVWIRSAILEDVHKAGVGRQRTQSTAHSTHQKSFNLALATLDVAEVEKMLSEGLVDPNGDTSLDETTPLYRVLTAADGPHHEKRSSIIAALLRSPTIDPNGDFRSWTPLKVAVSKQLAWAVELLLAHPLTVPEVHATGLRCSIQRDLHAEISIVVAPDSDNCWKTHARAIPESSSKLMKIARERPSKEKLATPVSAHTSNRASVSTAGPSATGPSAQEPYNPKNPFQDPPPGVLPPRDSLIMNPKAFRNVAEALTYYFLGSSTESPFLWIALAAICSGHFALMIYTIYSASLAAEENEQRHVRPAARAAAAPEGGMQ